MEDRPGLLDAAAYERAVILADGSMVRVRAIRADDEARLIAFYDRLSEQTAYQRFLGAMRRLPPKWAHFLANVDYQRRMALVAEHGTGPDASLVAVARYEPTSEPGVAELAFVVRDDWQNRGLGSQMLQDLVELAVANDVRAFRAYVLADNRRMLDMLGRFMDVRERKTEAGVVAVLCAPSARSRTATSQRKVRRPG